MTEANPGASEASPSGKPNQTAGGKGPDPQAITAMYESFVASLGRLGNVARVHRYTVGSRLEELQMNVLESLVRARYARKKVELLTDANVGLELCRLLVRALCDRKQVSVGLYKEWILELDDVGRQVGGWLRHATAREGSGDATHA